MEQKIHQIQSGYFMLTGTKHRLHYIGTNVYKINKRAQHERLNIRKIDENTFKSLELILSKSRILN